MTKRDMLSVYYWSGVRSWDEDFLDRNETLFIPQSALTEGLISVVPRPPPTAMQKTGYLYLYEGERIIDISLKRICIICAWTPRSFIYGVIASSPMSACLYGLDLANF
jgi:hypothetical protein